MSDTIKFWLFALLLFILYHLIHIGCDMQQLDERLNRIENHMGIPTDTSPEQNPIMPTAPVNPAGH